MSLNKIRANARCKLLSITLLVIIVGMSLLSVNNATAQIDQTTLKFQAANTAVNQAFSAVLDAEKAGANVTDLLSKLNQADSILAGAENSYRVGDLSQAAVQADSVLPIAQQVTSAAQNAKQTAQTNAQFSFYATIVLTVFGSVVFVLVLLMVWRRLKRSYIKNLSEAKPELVNE